MSIFLHKEIGTHLLYTDPIFKSLLELQENLYGFHFVCKAFFWLYFVLSSNTTTIQKCTKKGTEEAVLFNRKIAIDDNLHRNLYTPT